RPVARDVRRRGRVRSVGLPGLRHAVRSAAQGVVGEAAPGRMSEDTGPLWAGRFSKPPALEAEVLGRSLEVDERLAFQDVQAGIAHVAALRDAGLVTADEQERLCAALVEVRDAVVRETFVFDPHDEDIHSAIERGVTDL